MKLIIQIPCLNEEDTLAQTISELPKSICGIDTIEYLIIDDGSTDNTVKVARESGVHHIVTHKENLGLARAFKSGLDACVRLFADIIVNTDADNQYVGDDIAVLVEPILSGKAEIVVGERPILKNKDFSFLKKRMQRLGSLVVRIASGTKIPDAPSGFRAYSREAALRVNVFNEYTYTLETIIQAGNNRIPITSVPVRTNTVSRRSRLFKSMWSYMRRSITVIVRALVMYRPLKVFSILGTITIFVGAAFIIRWIVLALGGHADGNIQSLILSAMLVMVGVQLFIGGMQADIISANRKILEDVQYRLRKMETKDVEKKDGRGSA